MPARCGECSGALSVARVRRFRRVRGAVIWRSSGVVLNRGFTHWRYSAAATVLLRSWAKSAFLNVPGILFGG